jgi:hypothetical protein
MGFKNGKTIGDYGINKGATIDLTNSSTNLTDLYKNMRREKIPIGGR